jgi:hypothetical protein
MPLNAVFFFLSGFAVGMVIGSLVMLAIRS